MNCVICDAKTKLFKTVPFGTTCDGSLESSLPDVEYYKCEFCGHIQASDLLNKPESFFREYIYNDEYNLADPDCVETRPQNFAKWFILNTTPNKVLDWGCGHGKMVKYLNAAGIFAVGWDPFLGGEYPPPTESDFDLVTCIEVIEHHPEPVKLLTDMMTYMGKYSMIFMTTLIYEPGPSTEWYLAPRNGHVQMFTDKSIKLLAASANLKYEKLGVASHALYKIRPKWARHFVRGY